MRDPKRIDGILQEISNLWHKFPDMRLGQLISNVIQDPALYYVEDAELVKDLKMFYGELVDDDEEEQKRNENSTLEELNDLFDDYQLKGGSDEEN